MPIPLPQYTPGVGVHPTVANAIVGDPACYTEKSFAQRSPQRRCRRVRASRASE